MNDSCEQTHLGRCGKGAFLVQFVCFLEKKLTKSSASSVAQMSGVNDKCYVHYYIQQLNLTIYPCSDVETMGD